ncbi:MAG: hypothetical protein IPG67_14810 [Acidobacteria bacterium]|nr:hypothetical protein [Acidobacteriota bacterium]
MNLREDKGYTYGANSGFSVSTQAGPFRAGGDIQTAVTKSVWGTDERAKRHPRATPITQKELDYNKQGLIRRYPAGFGNRWCDLKQSSPETLVVYGLPDWYL